MSYEHLFTGTSSANGSSHDSAHQGEDERCPQPFLKRSQAHLSSDGNVTPNTKKQAVLSSSSTSDISSSQVASSSSQPNVMAIPQFLAPPNPFVSLDPALLSIMMSNPAVAMAGYAAMAAAAQNLSHHQQQVAAVLATNAAAAPFVRTNSNNTPLNCISTAATVQGIPPPMTSNNNSNNSTAALPAATIHVTHNNGNNHRRSAGSMSIGGGMVSDMSSSTATASSSQAPRRLSDRGYSLATDHSLKSALSSMASSTADPVPTLPSWGAAWAIPTPNGGSTSVNMGSAVPASTSTNNPSVLQHLLPAEVEKWKPAKLGKFDDSDEVN